MLSERLVRHSNAERRRQQIGRLAIHPTNPDIVYVGALGRLYGPNEERGLYKKMKVMDQLVFMGELRGLDPAVAGHHATPNKL